MAGRGKLPPIEITADDQASEVIEEVADAAEQLEKSSPEIEVTADTGRAEGDLDALAADMRAMPPVDVDTSAIESALARVRGEAKKTERAVADVGEKGAEGVGVGVNAVADMTGPLGDASSKGNEFGQVFEGAADIVAGFGAKLGLSEAQLGKVTSALGLAGLAVAAGTIAWGAFSAQSKKAAEQLKAMREAWDDLNKTARAGDVEEFNRALVETVGGLFAISEEMGNTTAATRDYLTGATDDLKGLGDAGGLAGEAIRAGFEHSRQAQEESARALDEVERRTSDLATAADVAARTQQGLADASERVTEALDAQRDAQRAFADSGFALVDSQDAFNDALAATAELVESGEADAEALEDAYRAERDAMLATADAAARVAEEQAAANGEAFTGKQRTDALNKALFDQATKASPKARNEIALYVGQLNGIPPEKLTTIMADTDPNNLAQVQREIANTTKDQTVGVTLDFLNVNDFANQVRRATGGQPLTAVPQMTTTTVHVHMPRGREGDDVVRAMNRHARRNGRLVR